MTPASSARLFSRTNRRRSTAHEIRIFLEHLDTDAVRIQRINRAGYLLPVPHDVHDEFIKSAREWLPLQGSIESIATLSRAGYTIAVATNQSGLARGLFDENALAAMHDKLRELVAEAAPRDFDV